MPRARIRAVQALAYAAASDTKLLDASGATGDVLERLQALPGFGPWTRAILGATRAA